MYFIQVLGLLDSFRWHQLNQSAEAVKAHQLHYVVTSGPPFASWELVSLSWGNMIPSADGTTSVLPHAPAYIDREAVHGGIMSIPHTGHGKGNW